MMGQQHALNGSISPILGAAVQIIDSLRTKHRVPGRSSAVAVGLSLQAGSCVVNHVVCGEWGWSNGPGSMPPMQRGDVITSVDGEMVVPADVGKKLHSGPLGSKVLIQGLRGESNLVVAVEATLLRQDAIVVDRLAHVEDALNEVKNAAKTLGGRAGSVLEARIAALGREVAKLGSACAKQEAVLSERYAVNQKHIKELEDSLIRIVQVNCDAVDEVGAEALQNHIHAAVYICRISTHTRTQTHTCIHTYIHTYRQTYI